MLLPLFSSVTLLKSLHTCKPQFLCLKEEWNNTYEGYWENKFIHSTNRYLAPALCQALGMHQCQRQSSSSLGAYVLVGGVRGWTVRGEVWKMEQGPIYRASWAMTRSSCFIFKYEGKSLKGLEENIAILFHKSNRKLLKGFEPGSFKLCRE